MSRMVLVLLAMSTMVGCRSGFDPLGLRGPSRVPPPPTGAVGDSYGDYYEPVPRPTAGQNSSIWGESEFRAPPVLSAAPLPRTTPSPAQIADNRASRNRNVADTRPTLQPADKLMWLDPAEPVGSGTSGRAYAPRLLPVPSATPLASRPPRIRGFPNAGRQEIDIPDELASRYRPDLVPGVRQASAEGRWQPRYDDIRR